MRTSGRCAVGEDVDTRRRRLYVYAARRVRVYTRLLFWWYISTRVDVATQTHQATEPKTEREARVSGHFAPFWTFRRWTLRQWQRWCHLRCCIRRSSVSVVVSLVRILRRFCRFYARKQLLLSARLSHRNSVCPSVTRVNKAKTVQARITKSSPSAAWKTLVSGTVKLFHKFEGGHPKQGR